MLHLYENENILNQMDQIKRNTSNTFNKKCKGGFLNSKPP